jgi:hypothetical protein
MDNIANSGGYTNNESRCTIVVLSEGSIYTVSVARPEMVIDSVTSKILKDVVCSVLSRDQSMTHAGLLTVTSCSL